MAGRPVGHVTSGSYSPTLGKPIAMGYIAPEFAQPGTELQIDIRGHVEPARVVELPFYRRIKHREGNRKDSIMPQDRLYSKTHEWVRVEADPSGGQIAVVGLTAFAFEALTDLVFVDLPAVGRQVRAGQPFGEIESVKAVSDLYSPVDGQIVEVNSAWPTTSNIWPTIPTGPAGSSRSRSPTKPAWRTARRSGV